MEAFAEWSGYVAHSIPAQLDDRCLFAGTAERSRKASGGATRMKDEVAIDWSGIRHRELSSECARKLGPPRRDVDKRYLSARQPRAQSRDQETDNAAADDPNAIGRRRAAIPYRVEGSFHVRRQHGTLWRNAVWHLQHGIGGQRKDVLMRMQREHHTIAQ